METVFAILIAIFVGMQAAPATVKIPDLAAPALSDFKTASVKLCASSTSAAGFGAGTELFIPEDQACPEGYYLETYNLKPYFYDQLKEFRLEYEDLKLVDEK